MATVGTYRGASIKTKTKVTALLNTDLIYQRLMDAVVAGVDEVTLNAYDKARELVPVRKVFKYGRKNVNSRLFAEQRIQGRQETRFLSLQEALSESLVRRRLGLSSAFPSTAGGRRRLGSQPLVRTAQFSESYRTRNRANPSDLSRRDIAQVSGVNRLADVREEMVNDQYGRPFKITRATPRPDIEADLSAAGRRELARATGPTLGGALLRSIEHTPAAANRTGTKVRSKITAGNKNVDYAKYVEFGTRRSRAQPFLRPALAQARLELPQVLKARIIGAGSSRR